MSDDDFKKSLGFWLEYNITNLMSIESSDRGDRALVVSNSVTQKPKHHKLKVYKHGRTDYYVNLYGRRLYFSDLICSSLPAPF